MDKLVQLLLVIFIFGVLLNGCDDDYYKPVDNNPVGIINGLLWYDTSTKTNIIRVIDPDYNNVCYIMIIVGKDGGGISCVPLP